MTLISARALGVLGEYDHKLSLPETEDFAIIYGPNGVGKTKFLEIIHAMAQLDGRTLLRIPFSHGILQFSDGSELTATRTERPSRKGAVSQGGLIFHLSRGRGELIPWSYARDGFEEWLLESTPWRPSDEYEEFWEDIRDGELVPLPELNKRYAHMATAERVVPDEFQYFRDRVSSYLIETQRLRIDAVQSERRRVNFHFGSSVREQPESKIAEQAAKMRSLVNDAQTEHSTITQQLDRTFPNRVLEGTTPRLDVVDIRWRYEEQNIFRSRLGRVASVQLAQALSLPDRELQEWEVRLLSLYLDDAGKKLAPFEVLLQKIELLEDIINARLLRKRLYITAKDGLLVQRDSDDRSIDLDSLSSGEQHEVILMFDLLFNVPEGALVLIDEPEISLHVAWQLAFIPDVQRIAELAGFRFVVATHSPQIINDKWDRAVPLGPEEVPFT